MGYFERHGILMVKIANSMRNHNFFKDFIDNIDHYEEEKTERVTLTIFLSKHFPLNSEKLVFLQALLIGYGEINLVVRPHINAQGLPTLKIKFTNAPN